MTLTVRLAPAPPKVMLVLGMRRVLEDVPVTVRRAGAVSASPTVKVRWAVAVSSLVVWLAMGEMAGGVLEAVTVSKKLVGVEAWPSLTETVMVAVPVWAGTGVTVAVRLAPEARKGVVAG